MLSCNKHASGLRLWRDSLADSPVVEVSTHSKPQLPNHDGHEFVCCVDKVIPLSAGRISEHIAGITSLALVMSDLVTVERH